MNIAVIFAGGVGSRMGSGVVPKQFLEINGKPVIVHTLELFESHPEIDAVVVSILPEGRKTLEKLIRRFELEKIRWIVDGGSTGQESRHRALQAIALEVPEDSVVLIHDGVRPLINAEIISENIAAVREFGNAITCTKLNETVTSVSDEVITEVIPRDLLFAAQAPQSFVLSQILSVYDQAVADGENNSIDSCTLMRHYGHALHALPGPRTNIKITTTEDFHMARTFFQLIENRQLEGSQ